MTLSFSQTINGKPTYFLYKIWEGLFRNIFNDDVEFLKFDEAHLQKFGTYISSPETDSRMEFPKIHSIREDRTKRWKVGMMIDFVINNRSKDRFVFAPKLPVKSIQDIVVREMMMTSSGYCYVTKNDRIFVVEIDGVRLSSASIDILAKQDGFESAEHFFEWFSSDFVGKLIHWTDFRYGL